MPHIIIETSKNILSKEALKIGQEIQQIMKIKISQVGALFLDQPPTKVHSQNRKDFDQEHYFLLKIPFRFISSVTHIFGLNSVQGLYSS